MADNPGFSLPTPYRLIHPNHLKKYFQYLLPEVFGGGGEDGSVSLASSMNLNLAPLPRKKLPGKLAPVEGLNLLDEDNEKSYGSNMIDRASKKIGQMGGPRKHGQLAPMNFN